MALCEREIASCLAANILDLIVLPTEACNFRCTYCYEDFKLGRMAPWVVRAVKNFLARRAADLDALHIGWFGGEPLLALDIIEDILGYTASLASEHPRLHVTSDITTNAYLLSCPVFEHLIDLGVSQYQVSLDGPREWHDQRRVLPNGRGTFERIWQNVVALRDVPGEFQVIIRIHADRENYAALHDFVRECRCAFEDDRRFKLFVRPLARLGGPNDARLPVFEAQEGPEAVRTLRQCADLGRAEFFVNEKDTPICYAARANSFVVRADGRLNKCTVALEHPMNQVGRLGEDGRLEIDAVRMRGWMRGLWSGNPEELECPMHGYADPGSRPRMQALAQAAGGGITDARVEGH